MQNRRICIAYMARDIYNSTGNQIWRGILNRAKNKDINLFCFRGGLLGKAQNNVIYEFVKNKNIDGIITWASSDINNNILKYYDSLINKPIVCLTLQVKNKPVVFIDDYHGMKELMNHFIRVHNYKKIAFIRGPENHISAQQRYQAYIDSLKENNIPFNKNLITTPRNWDASEGIESIKYFFDKLKLKPKNDIEAIVSVSDSIVIGVIEELKKRDIRFPDQISIAGFNNSDYAKFNTPSITSVSMPFHEQGVKAVDLLLSLINGDKKSENIELQSRIAIHQSCGCISKGVLQASVKDITNNYQLSFIILKREKSQKLKNISKEKIFNIPDNFYSEIKDKVIDYFKSDFKNINNIFIEEINNIFNAFFSEFEGNTSNRFIQTLNNVIYRIIECNENLEFLQDIISIIRRNIICLLQNQYYQLKAEDLWTQARVLISEAISRQKSFQTLKEKIFFQLLLDIGEKLITTFNIKDLLNILVKSLQELWIPSCYLSLYENQQSYSFLQSLPQWSKLILAYNEKSNNNLFKNEKRYFTEDLMPEGILPTERQFCYVVESLFFQETQLGYALFEVDSIEQSIVYRILRDQLSSSLKGALLLNEQKETEKLLENNLNLLQHKAKVVSKSSENISERVNDISGSMEEVASNINEISKNISEVMKIVNNATDMGNKTTKVVLDLSQHSQKIGKIIEFITDIANQTNVLSLNASIEAARAGNTGKGFAIVAREIKNLAKKIVKSTDEITQMIKMIQVSSDESTQSISNIIKIIKQISELSNIITSAITQQATTTNEISNLLTEAAVGTKEITEAITDVADITKLSNNN